MKAEAQFWDNLAERYAAQPVADVPAYQRKLEITKAKLRPADVIVDIGCGTGSLAIELAPRVSQVHAVDVSAEMLKIGKRKAEAAGLDNITFHQGTAQQLPEFDDESLDGVCAYNILHLVAERDTLYQQLMRRLKPGGFFISSTPCLGESSVPFGMILPVMRWFGKAPPVEILRQQRLLEELSQAGFANVSLKDVGAKPRVAFVVAEKPSSLTNPSSGPLPYHG